MERFFTANIQKLTESILCRKNSLFAEDYQQNFAKISLALSEARVVVIGAAGSIGRAFVEEISGYPLASLHLIDLSENGLAEVVRYLRASGRKLPNDFKTFSVAIEHPEASDLIEAAGYDYVANFAALKHVRSERNIYTAKRMVRTNVIAVRELLDQFSNRKLRKFFCLSSDKAVAPSSLMGATKALMEQILLSYSGKICTSTSRFANVLFSEGSLPCAFLERMKHLQPLSGPSDVRRYFISPVEAAQLCLLSMCCTKTGTILVPKFISDDESMHFSEIAERLLAEFNLKAAFCSSEDEAIRRCEKLKLSPTSEWPCYFSSSNTSGEKVLEEFVEAGEMVDYSQFSSLGLIQTDLTTQLDSIIEFLEELEALLASKQCSLESLSNKLSERLPNFCHSRSSISLDDKM